MQCLFFAVMQHKNNEARKHNAIFMLTCIIRIRICSGARADNMSHWKESQYHLNRMTNW